jgi:hypothetical protein
MPDRFATLRVTERRIVDILPADGANGAKGFTKQQV